MANNGLGLKAQAIHQQQRRRRFNIIETDDPFPRGTEE
jgi:hypothetical protein